MGTLVRQNAGSAVPPASVSAIIPTFNRRGYIKRAVDSILAQTVPVDEIVVIDDGSTDGTAEALEAWYGSLVRVIRQPRTGVSGGRLRGIQESRGEWVAFLDSDDEWTPDRNRQLRDAAGQAPPDVAWIFGDLRVVTDEGEDTTLFTEYGLPLAGRPRVFEDALSVQHPFQFGMFQASLIRRDVLLELNCFHEGLQTSEDVLAGFQVALRYRFAAIPFVVGKYFRTSDLAESSTCNTAEFRPDYFRARMNAFASVIRSGRKRPWNERYAAQARALCQALAARGCVQRQLAVQQFRYGAVSLKSVAFLFAALCGQRGLEAWSSLAAHRR
jgi:glycosyltransferase involved in cell wall biosynthesis